jgi:hypothetical protein
MPGDIDFFPSTKTSQIKSGKNNIENFVKGDGNVVVGMNNGKIINKVSIVKNRNGKICLGKRKSSTALPVRLSWLKLMAIAADLITVGTLLMALFGWITNRPNLITPGKILLWMIISAIALPVVWLAMARYKIFWFFGRACESGKSGKIYLSRFEGKCTKCGSDVFFLSKDYITATLVCKRNPDHESKFDITELEDLE